MTILTGIGPPITQNLPDEPFFPLKGESKGDSGKSISNLFIQYMESCGKFLVKNFI
jgi:hypothetical protein